MTTTLARTGHAAVPPTVVHVVYRFDTGGLENGVVNLINHMPAQQYRHVVLSLTDVTNFRQRIQRDDVEFIALNKPPGHGIWLYPRLYRLFRQMKPVIVHTRNLAALEVAVPAWAAGVPVRIHGEHGRDMSDPDGTRRLYQWVRRIYRPFVNRYVALSKDLGRYLTERVGVPDRAVAQIYNGVDVQRFAPARAALPDKIAGCPFSPQAHWLVGTVGRMQDVKDQTNLAQAFVLALARRPALRERLRLVMVGDGPLLARVRATLAEAGVADLCWLPGERTDIPDIMRGLNAFVLPSRGEGISNTILEAMASGLPVVATDVGGNAELVSHGRTGEIVPAADPGALATSLLRLADNPTLAQTMGRAGRTEAERHFSLAAMVSGYQGLYDQQLRTARAK